MLRSKEKFFEKGDQLICVHDIDELGMGDRVTVYDVCENCLGLLLEGYKLHYPDYNFELYNDEKNFHFHRDPDKIEKIKVANVFTDMIKIMMLNSHRGVYYVDPVMEAIKNNLKILGIVAEFSWPLNMREEETTPDGKPLKTDLNQNDNGAKIRLGHAIDRVSNIAAASQLPMPSEIHLEGIKKALPEIVQELRKAYADLTRDNK